MKPAAFDYVRAETADEAVQHLRALGTDARILAGGQSLMAVLNMRLAQPSALIDISRTEELNHVRAVISMPWKKSAAATVRRFDALRNTTSPPSASSTSGISALGSACATEPQTVPRLRIWKCEMKGKAWASKGTSCASVLRHSTLPCVAAAPTASMPRSARA